MPYGGGRMKRAMRQANDAKHQCVSHTSAFRRNTKEMILTPTSSSDTCSDTDILMV